MGEVISELRLAEFEVASARHAQYVFVLPLLDHLKM